jgi:plasmid stabilization system protein ParE
MVVRWTQPALRDLTRLHTFLASFDRRAANRTVQSLTAVTARLAMHPRIGERVDEFTSLEIRRVIVGQYEVRYEIRDAAVAIIRLWHTREDR